MPRYFLRLAFDGTRFHGWQRQPGVATVQQTLEEALGLLTRAPGGYIPVTGAGRTDAGVHASMMPVHVDMAEPTMGVERFVKALNSVIGRDIAVQQMVQVDDNAHARFDAVSRTYHYYVSLRKSPYGLAYCWQTPSQLDFDAMNDAAGILCETDDFTSFAKLHTDTRTNICHVTSAEWLPVPGADPTHYRMFEITADRFLRNMVRAIVGTLVEVGRGKLSIRGFRDIIESRNRCAAGTSMPPQALFLHHVTYPYLDW